MIKYNNGKTYSPKKIKVKEDKKTVSLKRHISSANRGMDLEGDINAGGVGIHAAYWEIGDLVDLSGREVARAVRLLPVIGMVHNRVLKTTFFFFVVI